jgi:hypothetical protein
MEFFLRNHYFYFAETRDSPDHDFENSGIRPNVFGPETTYEYASNSDADWPLYKNGATST